MSFTYTAEQEELRSSLRHLLAARAGSAELRAVIDSGEFDRTLWSRLADQLGLHGLGIPEEFGGAGFSAREVAVAFEETGRVLLAAPFFSTVGLAASVLLAGDDESAKKELLPGIADGSTIATVALCGPSGAFDIADLTAPPVQAVRGDAGWALTGDTAFVTDGLVADLVLVPARTGAGVSLFAVEAADESVTRVAMQALDLTRPLAKIAFASTPARLIGTDGAAEPGLRTGLEHAIAYLAAEQVGAAQRCLDLSVDYAKVRVQFERPIGSFQAIKHKAADMLVAVETARSAALYAAQSIADGSDETSLAVAMAGVYCSDAFFSVAAETIQIHG